MSDQPFQFDAARFINTLTKNGHNRLIGAQYHAHGDDWCELAIPYNPELVSDSATGILASGPIFTLMDMATSLSIWLKTGTIQPQATLDLRIDYLRPAKPGQTVIGHGECYHITRSIAFIRGHAHDGDPEKPIAHVAGTYFFTAS
ncbi:MAG: PaaI family thioesterase [Sphingomonadaceae bacterium]|nr:PaaI family thioesterase [Sphingomonadaceae bacterium]